MTIARELKIRHSGDQVFLASEPVKELSVIKSKPVIANDISVSKTLDSYENHGSLKIPSYVKLERDQIKDFSIVLSNGDGEKLVIGFDRNQNKYFIDRTQSGKTDFEQDFPAIHEAPRLTNSQRMNLSLVIDVSSVEMFADDGLTVMTEIFFPNKPFDQIHFETPGKVLIRKLEYSKLTPSW